MSLAIFGLLLVSPSVAQPEEPSSYRMDEYRAPLPATLSGAKVITTKEAEDLWRNDKAIFVDVMVHKQKPQNLPESTIWKESIRLDIPNSIWLPNVGYGEITAETASYFKAGLQNRTGNDKTAPLVFYCMADCWMSWNAAKRAIEFGYKSVIWYPVGTDGWENYGLPLEANTPFVGD